MKLKILIISLVFWIKLYAQDNKAQHIQQLLEYIQQEETDSEVLVNFWWQYLDHPVEIKKLNKTFLEELIFLSPLEISQILSFCKENQPILHVHELQFTPKLNEQSFLLLSPFVYVKQHAKQLSTKSKQEILIRFAQTFDDKQDSKQAEKIYTHFRSQHKWYRFGFLAEKDAGENWPHRGGFDFYSGHLYLQHPKKNIQLALGDFHIKMGQGLMLYQGYSSGVGAQINSIKRQDFRLKPYTGTNENDFFRGIATSWTHKSLQASAFYSNRQRDASIYNENGQSYFINFNNSGLHVSQTDLEKKDRIKELNYGVSLRWKHQKASLGCHYMNSHYDATQRKESSSFSIIGDQFKNTAIDFSLDLKNHHLFGEWSYDFSKQAFLIGALSPLGDQFSLALLFSKNESGFHAPYAQLFNGQNSGAYDFYLGLNYEYNTNLHFSFYHTSSSIGTNNTEQLLFPENKKIFTQVSYRIRRGPSTYLQYQSIIKQNATEGLHNNTIANQIKQQKVRWHNEIPIHENLKFRFRIEFQHYRDEIDINENSWMIYQEFKYKPLKSPVSLLVRYVLFDTTFETRIYAYEQQVRYQYSSAQFYGQGEQIYLLTHYKISKNYECWLRYAYYNFTRKEEQITQQQLTAQIRINL